MLRHSGVRDAAFLQTGGAIVSSTENEARFWNVHAPVRQRSLEGAVGHTTSASFSADNSLLAILQSTEDMVRVYEVGPGRLRYMTEQRPDRVLKVEFTPDGRFLVTLDSAGELTFRAPNSGMAVYNIRFQDTSKPKNYVIAPAKETVVVWSEDTAEVWNVEKHSLVGSVDVRRAASGQSAGVDGQLELEPSPTGRYRIARSRGDTFWRLESGRFVTRSLGRDVVDATFAKDGRLFALTRTHVQTRDPTDPALVVRSVPHGTGDALRLFLSQDQHWLKVSRSSSIVFATETLEARSGRTFRPLEAFAGDPDRGLDHDGGGYVLMDTETGQPIERIAGDSDDLRDVIVDSAGRMALLVRGSRGRPELQELGPPTAKKMARAKKAVSRCLPAQQRKQEFISTAIPQWCRDMEKPVP